jgi:hypothetical protein
MKLLFSPPRRTMIPYLGFAMGASYDGLKQRRKESLVNHMVDEMDKEIKRLSPNYVYVSTVPNFQDVRPFKWNAYDVDVRYEYAIDIKKPLEEIWAGFNSACTGSPFEADPRQVRHCDPAAVLVDRRTADLHRDALRIADAIGLLTSRTSRIRTGMTAPFAARPWNSGRADGWSPGTRRGSGQGGRAGAASPTHRQTWRTLLGGSTHWLPGCWGGCCGG